MNVKVLTSADQSTLAQIKQTFLATWVSSKVNTQQVLLNFDRKVSKQSDELIYAVLVSQKGKILIIASLFLEYKLTRGLSQIYHLQIEYKDCGKEQEQFFQQEVVKLIPGYKITGLGVASTSTFKPHQVYMDLDVHKNDSIKGKF